MFVLLIQYLCTVYHLYIAGTSTISSIGVMIMSFGYNKLKIFMRSIKHLCKQQNHPNLGVCMWWGNRGTSGTGPLQQHTHTKADHCSQPVCGQESGCTLRRSTCHGSHCGWQGKVGMKEGEVYLLGTGCSWVMVRCKATIFTHSFWWGLLFLPTN